MNNEILDNNEHEVEFVGCSCGFEGAFVEDGVVYCPVCGAGYED